MAKRTKKETEEKKEPKAKKPAAAKKPTSAKKAEAASKPASKTSASASAKKTTSEKKPAAKEAAAAPKSKAARKPEAPAAKAPASAKAEKPAAAKAAKPVAASAPAPAARKASAQKPPLPRGKSPVAEVTANDMLAIEDDARELPLEYGDTKIVAMVRDPEWIFAYWEISNDTRREKNIKRGSHDKSLALRVFELDQNEQTSGNWFDVPVNDYTSSWYVRIPREGAGYRVQLGVFDANGDFEPIAASGAVMMPRRHITEESDVEFAEINDEIYNQIVHLSGGVKIGDRLGSDDFLRSLQQRVFQTLSEGPFSSGLSSGSLFGLSSGAMYGLSSQFLSSGGLYSSAGLLGGSSGFVVGAGGEESVAHRRAGKERGFWLEVGVDVIVYGATEPDAKVKFMGREIQLTPDGTFRFRMVLPDTTIEFPIEATSADGVETRQVTPIVNRKTDGDPHKPV